MNILRNCKLIAAIAIGFTSYAPISLADTDAVKKELKDQGFTVLPNSPLLQLDQAIPVPEDRPYYADRYDRDMIKIFKESPAVQIADVVAELRWCIFEFRDATKERKDADNQVKAFAEKRLARVKEIMEFLVQKMNLNDLNIRHLHDRGASFLERACMWDFSDDFWLVNFFLKNNANITSSEQLSSDQPLPFLLRIYDKLKAKPSERRVKLLKILLASYQPGDTFINDASIYGITPLMAAAYFGDKEIVAQLISLGADPFASVISMRELRAIDFREDFDEFIKWKPGYGAVSYAYMKKNEYLEELNTATDTDDKAKALVKIKLYDDIVNMLETAMYGDTNWREE